MPTEPAPADASTQVWRSALLLGGAVGLGLAGGAVIPATAALLPFALPALALQTLLTVGVLPSLRGTHSLSRGLRLVAIHAAVSTAPTAVIALLIGLDDPLGFGLFVIAVAPPAALVPAYAEVAGVDVAPLLVFVLVAYGLSLVFTPGMLLLAAGATVGVAPIAFTLGVGLIGPALLARAASPVIQRVPQRPRRTVVNASVLVITLGLGSGLVEALTAGTVDTAGVVLAGALVLARTFGSGWLAARVSSGGLCAEAPFAGGFKNIALAAAVAATLAGPAAALPALLAFPVEAVFFLALARRRVDPVPASGTGSTH